MIKTSSDRSFGLVFTTVFGIIGLIPLWHGQPLLWWSLILASLFLILSLIQPKILHPLNQVWTRFGLLLHKIVSPVVMSVLFFLTVVPIGLLMRLFGKDPLKLRFDPQAKSYWIIREQPGPTPESMNYQF